MKITELKVGDLVLLGETGQKCCPYHRLEGKYTPPPGAEIHVCEVVRVNSADVILLVPKRYGNPLSPGNCVEFDIPDFKRYQHDWRRVFPDAIIRREEGSW